MVKVNSPDPQIKERQTHPSALPGWQYPNTCCSLATGALNKSLTASGVIWQAGFKMSRPSSVHDERGVNQNEDPGGHRSVFTNTRSAAAAAAATATPETRLLSAFKKDTQARKVQLAGRGESVHLPVLTAGFNLLFPSKVAPGNKSECICSSWYWYQCLLLDG